MNDDPLCNATKRDLCAPADVIESRLTPTLRAKPRPYEFDAAVADEVVIRVASGAGLAAACVDPAMPTWRTFRRWCVERPELRARYRAAQAERAAALADEVLEISDAVDDPARVGIARLRTDSRKWLASKLDPARWGDRLEVDQRSEVTVTVMPPLELARRIAFLLESGAQEGLDAASTLAHAPAQPESPGDDGSGGCEEDRG